MKMFIVKDAERVQEVQNILGPDWFVSPYRANLLGRHFDAIVATVPITSEDREWLRTEVPCRFTRKGGVVTVL